MADSPLSELSKDQLFKYWRHDDFLVRVDRWFADGDGYRAPSRRYTCSAFYFPFFSRCGFLRGKQRPLLHHSSSASSSMFRLFTIEISNRDMVFIVSPGSFMSCQVRSSKGPPLREIEQFLPRITKKKWKLYVAVLDFVDIWLNFDRSFTVVIMCLKYLRNSSDRTAHKHHMSDLCLQPREELNQAGRFLAVGRRGSMESTSEPWRYLLCCLRWLLFEYMPLAWHSVTQNFSNLTWLALGTL
jgi:hypothetical protein